jgi:Eco57I restriction-modification methylase
MEASPLPELGEIHECRKNPMQYIIEQTAALRVRKEEKNKFGEVFTPLTLINNMLDKLPKGVWSDPTKKWLDPATGIGNFPMMVYARLMDGLATHPDFIDLTVRSEHIIRQMLYMVELNPQSCARIRTIFGSAANLWCDSFLGPIHFTDGTTQFDVIVGNPPFNADQTHEGKKGGGSNLWPEFVDHSLYMIAPEGYLLFVHPALWRKPPSDRAKTLFDKMVHDNHMLCLSIYSKCHGNEVFGVQTRFDYYVIQKRRPIPMRDFTIVKDQLGTEHQLDLSRWRFLPNHSFESIEPLLSDKEENYVIFSRGQYGSDKSWVHNSKDDEYNFPLVHSTPLGEPRIYWSAKKNDDCKDCKKMFGVPKVIFGESGINNVIIDYRGEYGMTQGAIGLKIPGEGEGELMKKALESAEFHRILDAMSFSNFRIDWRMFLYFRPDFYKHPMFQESPKYVRPSRRRLAPGACVDNDAEDADDAAAHNMTFSRVTGARAAPQPSTSRKKPSTSSNIGGRTRRRKSICKRRKYKQLRRTRKKY